uniref:Uncharacterized protein n=1 Tax=Solanum tuberosum TaxID=4113 RepID=M1BET6_SOLTU
MNIWVESVGGKKKGRVKGLGSLGRSVKASSKQSTSALSREIYEMIKSRVNASNVDLNAQLQKERLVGVTWKIHMIVLLWREGSIHAIDKKYPDYTLYSDKKKVGGDVLTVIQLSLAPNMLCEKHFKGDKGDKASGLFMRGRTRQRGKSKSKSHEKKSMWSVGAITRRDTLNEIVLCQSPKKR